MKAGNQAFHSYLEQKNHAFVIPIYQRYYDWQQAQCQRLFLDIETSIKEQNKHFFGAVVYVVDSSNEQKHIIIDGQQRITTLSLLYLALYHAEEDRDFAEHDILYTFLKNRNPEETFFEIKLHSIEKDRVIYERLLRNPDVEVKSSNIYDNYLFFKQAISESLFTPREIYRGLQRLEVAWIRLETGENPQKVFESLNSKGLKLSQGDLIRNYLLMGLAYEEQKRLYQTFWQEIEKLITLSKVDEFVRYYLTIQNGVFPKKDAVYESFKRFCEKRKQSVEETLTSLLAYAKVYSFCLKKNHPNKEINQALQAFSTLKQEIVYPLAMTVLHPNAEEADQVKCIAFLVSYVYRRAVCKLTSNGLSGVVATEAQKLNRANPTDMYEKLCTAILAKVGSGSMPEDDDFKQSFMSEDMYKLAAYTLVQLERISHREAVDADNLQVEHIMPQKLNSDWEIALSAGNRNYKDMHSRLRHCIGNLALTGYNQNMSNKSFSEKRQTYEDSNVRLTRDLVRYDQWGEEQIKQRSKELAEQAIAVWHYPKDHAPDHKLRDGEYSIMTDLTVTGVSPKRLSIDGKSFSADSWRKLIITLMDYLYQLDKDYFRNQTEDFVFVKSADEIMSVSNNWKEISHSGLYLNTHGTANQLLSYCRKACEVFDMADSVSYWV